METMLCFSTGKALTGKKAGSVVEVEVPTGVHVLEIKSVSRVKSQG